MPAEFDNMVNSIKKSLRKQFPNKSEKEISSAAFGIATINFKKKHGRNP